jgi:NDP-sugar pyrophosphorylase family protein
MALRSVDDGAELRGTGGALRHALDALDDTFLLTYGDSYLPFDYAAPLVDLRAHPDAEATMSVMRNQGRWDASNVRLEGERVAWYGKAGNGEAHGDADLAHIDYGAIAMRKSTVHALPEGPGDLAVTLGALAARGALRALVVKARFYEIGSAAGIDALEAHLRERAHDEGGR